MKHHCSQCARTIFLLMQDRRTRDGVEGFKDFDLCQRCYRSLRQKIVAARLQKKPWWAYRSTLFAMHQQTAPAAKHDILYWNAS